MYTNARDIEQGYRNYYNRNQYRAALRRQRRGPMPMANEARMASGLYRAGRAVWNLPGLGAAQLAAGAKRVVDWGWPNPKRGRTSTNPSRRPYGYTPGYFSPAAAARRRRQRRKPTRRTRKAIRKTSRMSRKRTPFALRKRKLAKAKLMRPYTAVKRKYSDRHTLRKDYHTQLFGGSNTNTECVVLRPFDLGNTFSHKCILGAKITMPDVGMDYGWEQYHKEAVTGNNWATYYINAIKINIEFKSTVYETATDVQGSDMRAGYIYGYFDYSEASEEGIPMTDGPDVDIVIGAAGTRHPEIKYMQKKKITSLNLVGDNKVVMSWTVTPEMLFGRSAKRSNHYMRAPIDDNVNNIKGLGYFGWRDATVNTTEIDSKREAALKALVSRFHFGCTPLMRVSSAGVVLTSDQVQVNIPATPDVTAHVVIDRDVSFFSRIHDWNLDKRTTGARAYTNDGDVEEAEILEPEANVVIAPYGT